VTLPRRAFTQPLRGFRAPQLRQDGTVVLCRTAAEARRAMTLGDALLVATAPDAACELMLAGADHVAFEDLYDITLWRDLDEPLLAFQDEWATRVDQRAHAVHDGLCADALCPVEQTFFLLKVLADTLMRTAVELAHLMIAARPGRIVAFRGDDPVPGSLFFPHGAHAAVLPALGVEIAWETRPADAAPQPAPTAPSRASVLRAELARLRAHGVGARLAAVSGALRGADVVYQGGSDVDHTVGALRRRGWRAAPSAVALRQGRRAAPPPLGDDWQRLGAELRGEPIFGEAFHWAGLDLRPAAETRLRAWWNDRVPAVWSASRRAGRAFARRRPRAVLTYSPWSAEDHGVLHAARRAGIPAATYQHGGFEGNCEAAIYRRTDLRYAERRLVYGPATAAYFDDLAGAPVARAAGSSRLDALDQRSDRRAETRAALGVGEGETLVLYLPTSYQYDWYAARQAAIGVDHFRMLAGVVDAVVSAAPARVVYKPFPELPPDPVARLLEARATNAIVVRDVPVPDLLQAADACVLDIPSTALLEALGSDIPLLLLADARTIGLRDEARVPLSRRVRLTESHEDFLAALPGFLREPRATGADLAFVEAYAPRDGRAAERAADAIAELAGYRVGAVPASR
jgi:hypothetical protein